jgi:predicted nucleotidyltransferase
LYQGLNKWFLFNISNRRKAAMNSVRKHWMIIFLVAMFFSIITLLIATGVAFTDSSSFTEITSASLAGVYESSVAWGDYDNDGDLDILLTGMDSGHNRVSAIYSNDGSDAFTVAVTDPITDVYQGSVAWGDYDNDGDLDMLLTGDAGSDNLVANIYRNDGSDTFTDIGASLTGVDVSSVAWGDYDNDGDLDILLTGHDGQLRVTNIYRNDGLDSFVLINTSALERVTDGSVAWGDYDNDSDLDILLTGYNGEGVAKVYRNDGSDTFTDISASLTGVANSSAAWGDYDNDGDLDILITGYWSGFTAKVYRNDGSDTFTDISASLTGVSNSSSAWGDYDNDGDLDILITGNNVADNLATVYRNDGSDVFTAAITDTLSGVLNGSVAWGDYDNDTDLDILLTGWDGSNRITKLYRNDVTTINILPNSPTNLNADVADNVVTLSWDAPSPASTTPISGLTYNLRVGTAPGLGDIVPPHAFSTTDPSTNGLRLLPAMGNVQMGLTATLKLSDSTYYWSVQAVDHTFAGSPFATEHTFIVGTPPPTGVTASDGKYTDRVEVSWNSVAGATHYEVYRSTSSDGAKTLLGSPSSSPYDDTSALMGTTYYYFVKACNGNGCSDFSSHDTGYRAGTVPAIPTGVSATDGSYTDRVHISWNSVAGATYYEVYRSTSSEGTKTLLGSPSSSPYDDTSALVGTTYYYWVKACNDNGCSDFSSYDTGYRAGTEPLKTVFLPLILDNVEPMDTPEPTTSPTVTATIPIPTATATIPIPTATATPPPIVNQ